MSGPYDDIIHLPHPVSPTHPQMSIANRAAQFSPFAALTGYDAAVAETARLTGERIALEEDARDVLDQKQRILADVVDDHPEIAVTYFQPDAKKDGGAYVTVTGALKKIDEHERYIRLMNGQKIAIDDILDMECDLFGYLEGPL